MFLFRCDRKYLQSSDIFSFIFNNFDFTTLDLHFTKKWKKSFYKANIKFGKIKIKKQISNFYQVFLQSLNQMNCLYHEILS